MVLVFGGGGDGGFGDERDGVHDRLEVELEGLLRVDVPVFFTSRSRIKDCVCRTVGGLSESQLGYPASSA